MDYSIDAVRKAYTEAAKYAAQATFRIFGDRPDDLLWPTSPKHVDETKRELAKPQLKGAMSNAQNLWSNTNAEVAEKLWADIRTEFEVMLFEKPRAELTEDEKIEFAETLAAIDQPNPHARNVDETMGSIDPQQAPRLAQIKLESLRFGLYIMQHPVWKQGHVEPQQSAMLNKIHQFDDFIWRPAVENARVAADKNASSFSDMVKKAGDIEGATAEVLGDQAWRLGNTVKAMIGLAVNGIGVEQTVGTSAAD